VGWGLGGSADAFVMSPRARAIDIGARSGYRDARAARAQGCRGRRRCFGPRCGGPGSQGSG